MSFKIQTICFLLLASTTAVAGGSVSNAGSANPDDVVQAEKFLTGLPNACSASHAYASSDGTVNIRIICNGSGKSTDGLVSIKNGVVTKIR